MSAAEVTPPKGSSPYRWMVIYLVNVAAVGALKLTGAINAPTGFILLALASFWFIPFIRASQRSAAAACASEATIRYNKRMLVSSFGYVLGLGAAITVWRSYELATPAVFAIALLPVIPTMGMIWAMGRYLIEEKDEYLRHRTIMAALFGLGLVLTLGIFYGFLETFELVPHIWAWWVLPAWAIGLALGMLWQKVRER